MFGFYIICFGTISPGGGFQGGVIVAAACILLYLAYGHKTTTTAINEEFIRVNEAIGAVLYVLLGFCGLSTGLLFKIALRNDPKGLRRILYIAICCFISAIVEQACFLINGVIDLFISFAAGDYVITETVVDKGLVPTIIARGDGNTQVVVLGTGDPEYEDSFRYYGLVSLLLPMLPCYHQH